MSERALKRKLGRAMQARQMVAAGGGGQFGAFDIQRNPREWIADEQDRKRENLAETLLLTMAEGIGWESASATAEVMGLAAAALAAATVLYPELPDVPDDEGGLA